MQMVLTGAFSQIARGCSSYDCGEIVGADELT